MTMRAPLTSPVRVQAPRCAGGKVGLAGGQQLGAGAFRSKTAAPAVRPSLRTVTESPTGDQRPAASLVGITTPDGWTIMSAISRPPGATGGHFSCSYIAERDGERAFLKAIDYVAALSAPDPARAL